MANGESIAYGCAKAFRTTGAELARAVSFSLVNIYMVKMAGVFMISTSTVAISTRFAPRWLAALGYLLAALLLIGSSFLRWSFALFPLWGAPTEHRYPGGQGWPELGGLRPRRKPPYPNELQPAYTLVG